ncbi:unnamed protein product [Didymodactylos carnosus]|uniref:Eukaryotic translation initiation factor 5 n=1 Tax=Didymodactylos carnosus TaxID=1234261 RepID=A0A815UUX5_9BILA|nr:unnamed protein product [Didymodactylos carnosus]CAF1522087.1 unnamed protein product [Didymodactylos carnosus]CAF4158894.1 unnamed protein product [Didymodactylos carnosus]CAF4381306.1 unnamed protein product [Didymodactylos carnosus]
MAMINVNRNTNDMFYRYKMPKLVAKIEGTGNGIKTVIVNMTQIAKALSRPPTYVTKYFGCELGAQVQMIAKDDRYIVNGAHDAEKLQNLLDGFIKRFVLCPSCDNPETQLSFRNRNGGEIRQVCIACGHQGGINMASHKLTTYISKYPPDAEGKSEGHEGKENGGTKAKGGKAKKEKKAAGGKNSDEDSPVGAGKANGASKTNGAGDDDDENGDWGDEDLSPTDGLNAKKKLDLNVKSMIQSDDLDKPVAERCEMFSKMLESKKASDELNNTETIKELLAEAERLEIMEKAPFVVAQCLFTENILKELDVYKALLLKLCTKNSKGQKYFLHGLESLISAGSLKEKLFNKKSISKVFLKLYEDDIIEEETFYSWYDKKVAKEIREMSKDFIEWLKTADETSEEEEGGDDNEEETEAEKEKVAINFSYAAEGLEVAKEKSKSEAESKIEVNGEIINVDDI